MWSSSLNSHASPFPALVQCFVDSCFQSIVSIKKLSSNIKNKCGKGDLKPKIDRVHKHCLPTLVHLVKPGVPVFTPDCLNYSGSSNRPVSSYLLFFPLAYLPTLLLWFIVAAFSRRSSLSLCPGAFNWISQHREHTLWRKLVSFPVDMTFNQESFEPSSRDMW